MPRQDLSHTIQSSNRDGIDNENNILAENETERLQRDVDNFTHKLEQEKHRLLIIDDQLRDIKDEYNKKYKRTQREKTKEKSETKLHENQLAGGKKEIDRPIKTMENQLDHAIVKQNETLSYNKKMRGQIDQMRRERYQLQLVLSTLDKEVQVVQKNAEEQYKKQNRSIKETEECHLQMTILQAKAEEEQVIFTQELKDLEDQLKSEKKEREEQLKKFTEKLLNKKSGAQEELLDATPILRKLQQKWLKKNIEKKKEIDTFMRNMKQIEEAFAQIKDATGINDIDEIVTTFIKSEEQNYSLQNYVSLLNSEIDQQEESNNDLNNLKAKQERQLGMHHHKEEIEKLNNTLKNTNKQLVVTEESINHVKTELENVQEPVELLIEEFKTSRFRQEVINNIINDENAAFTDQNIGLFLSSLEEQINLFINYKAKDLPNDEKNKIQTSVIQNKIRVKDFKNKTKVNVRNVLADLSDDYEEEDEDIENKSPIRSKGGKKDKKDKGKDNIDSKMPNIFGMREFKDKTSDIMTRKKVQESRNEK